MTAAIKPSTSSLSLYGQLKLQPPESYVKDLDEKIKKLTAKIERIKAYPYDSDSDDDNSVKNTSRVFERLGRLSSYEATLTDMINLRSKIAATLDNAT